MLKAINVHLPNETLWECVVTLKQRTPDNPISDADFFVNELIGLGYWCMHTTIDSKDFGGEDARKRLWWHSTYQHTSNTFSNITYQYIGI